ncbi:hypothetical protein [Thermus caliditerrae]|uniref:hypothetical protein n=1 Tax=Thermus caliditerrae TaxID=1330700 RepID=UPI001F3570B9|nr:hypothetical protein [Thermus caliditerrae]
MLKQLVPVGLLGVLLVLVAAGVFSQSAPGSPASMVPRNRLEIEPLYMDGAIKGDSVSLAISPDGKRLFVAILDNQQGLRVYRIPVERVP